MSDRISFSGFRKALDAVIKTIYNNFRAVIKKLMLLRTKGGYEKCRK